MNPETFQWNKKRNENYSNSKNFISPDTLSDKFPQITQKFATLYFFYPFLSCFFCIKFFFKNFVCVIFLNQYPNLKAAELTVWTYCLILHTKAPEKHYPVEH